MSAEPENSGPSASISIQESGTSAVTGNIGLNPGIDLTPVAATPVAATPVAAKVATTPVGQAPGTTAGTVVGTPWKEYYTHLKNPGPDTDWIRADDPSGFSLCIGIYKTTMPRLTDYVNRRLSEYPALIAPQQGQCHTTDDPSITYSFTNGVCMASYPEAILCNNSTRRPVFSTPPVRTMFMKAGIPITGQMPTQKAATKAVQRGVVMKPVAPQKPTPPPPTPAYITSALSILETIASTLEGINTNLQSKAANTPIAVEPNTPISTPMSGGRRKKTSKQNKRAKRTRKM